METQMTESFRRLLDRRSGRFTFKPEKCREGGEIIAQEILPDIVERLKRTISDPTLAEDFAHEAFIKVMEVLSTNGLENPALVESYFYRTAYLMYLQSLRRRYHSDERRTEFEQDIDANTNVESQVLRTEISSEVSAALAQMGQPRDREVIRRRYLLEQSTGEICSALGLDAAHLHRVTSRARTRLGASLRNLRESIEV